MLLFRESLGEDVFVFADAQVVTAFIASMHCIYLAVHVYLLVRETRQFITTKAEWALNEMKDFAEKHGLRDEDKPDVAEDDEHISTDMLMYRTFDQMLHFSTQLLLKH